MGGRIIAFVGMPGSGKTDAAEFLLQQGYHFLRFGQLTLDEVKNKGLSPTEENERQIRETLRKEHGMAAYAKLNIPKIDEMLKKGNVAVDGVYSWAEYVVLKEKYGDKLTVAAICASPKTRYERLSKRKSADDDKDMKRRTITKEDAKKRDFAEIENIQKGGPIAMADYTIVNEGSIEELKENILNLME